jgi:pSer/pThr/pTyr-binding forkhead associated (FHA) protein/ribosomal protein L40E
LGTEDYEIGVVCGHCDAWAPLGASRCAVCRSELSLAAPRTPTGGHPPARSASGAFALGALGGPKAAPPNATAPRAARAAPASQKQPAPKNDFAHLSQEELMEQARNYVCRSCSSGVPVGHKFCGRCGTAVPPEILNAQTLFFGDMQNPAKAKLILIRGEGMDGLSFHLKAEQHIVGRNGQLVFPDDPFVSPKHANFFYRDGKLVVRDEGSLNGVYVRVRGTVDIAPGDTFLAGEQVFRLEATPRASDGQDQDGTYFYSSPKHPSPFRISQLLQGGGYGMTVCARGTSLQIGREGGDLNFPQDLYMSGSHARIEEHGGKFTLTDLNSRNGTYVRIKGERDLTHGDYIFIGRKLLRVELNTN